MKYFIVLVFLIISSLTFAQKNECDLSKVNRFCCYEWLPEFKDSISIVVDELKVNQSEKYCVLTKEKRKKYGLHCWTGEVGLETPTEWKRKLKVKFKKGIIVFKFGKNREKYKIYSVSKEEFYLIKIN